MHRVLTNVPGLLMVLGIVAVWQLSFEFGLIRLTSIPTPWQIALGLTRLGREGRLLAPVLHTVGLVLAGSAIAIVLGTVIGAVLGLSSVAHRWMMASVDFFRSLPAVALLPMAVMFWGPTNTSEMVVIVYSATWIMAINAAGSIAAVSPRLGDVATTLRIGRLDSLLKIWLPAATAGLLVGARLAVITAAITAIIAETLVNPRGLGWEIVSAQRAMQPVRLWSYAILAGVFGYFLNGMLVLAVRHLSPGGRANPAMTGA